MEKQTSNQNACLVLALMVLVLVVVNRVAAGTRCVITPAENTAIPSKTIQSELIGKVISELEDLPWSPLISFWK